MQMPAGTHLALNDLDRSQAAEADMLENNT
jgi:hypothetical protein